MILRRNGYVRHEPCPVLGADDNDNDNNNKNINEVDLIINQIELYTMKEWWTNTSRAQNKEIESL